MDDTKQLLERLKLKEKLDSPTLEHLARSGFITVSETTNHQTPPGRREFLFIDFTEKARKLLQSQ